MVSCIGLDLTKKQNQKNNAPKTFQGNHAGIPTHFFSAKVFLEDPD